MNSGETKWKKPCEPIRIADVVFLYFLKNTDFGVWGILLFILSELWRRTKFKDCHNRTISNC